MVLRSEVSVVHPAEGENGFFCEYASPTLLVTVFFFARISYRRWRVPHGYSSRAMS
jgi:hypothetical protein